MKTALTIGFFDGVHLGHQALLRQLRQHPHATILTFSNHPQEVTNPPAPSLLMPPKEKKTLLETYADEVIILPFTLEFAKTPFEELLDQFDLSHLILGTDSVFGKDRKGDETAVKIYAEQKGIKVQYIPKILFDGKPISSSRIRKAINNNDAILAQQLLGRPI